MIVSTWMPPSRKPTSVWINARPEIGRSGTRAGGAAVAADRAAGAGATLVVSGTPSSVDGAVGVADASAVGVSSAGRRARAIDGGRDHRIIPMTMKLSAFRTNAKSTPPAAIRTPPIAGPTMKLTLPRLAHAEFAGPS